jgi:glutamyl-tRNA(Gln) amidotransferase subunit E
LEKINIKCGIEIHQRLATKHKLFCGCRTVLDEAPCKTIVSRRLAAVSGELGALDPAARFEAQRKREFEYQFIENSACLVDTDEEPPFELNAEALDTALQVAKMLNSTIVDEIFVMRKTVVDGSATSGFQRTALVALGGFVETSFGKVGIQTVCIEEESSGIVAKPDSKNSDSKKANAVTYRLDRLGIPLVEIATDPDIKSGEQAKEVAQKIGTMLRATGKVQRGIGTIRQDLNVSVSGGNRVEIKGAQELDALDKIVENEAKRQVAIAALAKKASKKLEASEIVDVTTLFSKATAPFIQKALASGSAGTFAIKLSNFSGLLGVELMENHRFGTELSAYAKAAAQVGGIIHSDENLQEKYGITKETAGEIAKAVACKKGDAWVAVVAEKHKSAVALDAVVARAAVVHAGVVKETRRAVGEKTEYMRPLPGSDRMYPETDVPPVSVSRERIDSIELPKSFEERAAKYEKDFGLSPEMAKRIAKDYAESFELFAQTNADASFIATTLAETLTALRRKGADTAVLTPALLSEFFELFGQNKFTKSAAVEILEALCAGKTLEDALAQGFARLTKKQVLEIVAKKKKEMPGIAPNALFGQIIRQYRLTVDPADLSEAIEHK